MVKQTKTTISSSSSKASSKKKGVRNLKKSVKMTLPNMPVEYLRTLEVIKNISQEVLSHKSKAS